MGIHEMGGILLLKMATSVDRKKLRALSVSPCPPFLTSLTILSSTMYSSTLKKEGECCSETFVPICHTTEHRTSEDSNLYIHHPENLQSHYKQDCWSVLKIMEYHIISQAHN